MSGKGSRMGKSTRFVFGEVFMFNRNPAIRFVGQNPKKKNPVDLTSAYLAF